jgi:hypothetical protein
MTTTPYGAPVTPLLARISAHNLSSYLRAHILVLRALDDLPLRKDPSIDLSSPVKLAAHSNAARTVQIALRILQARALPDTRALPVSEEGGRDVRALLVRALCETLHVGRIVEGALASQGAQGGRALAQRSAQLLGDLLRGADGEWKSAFEQALEGLVCFYGWL